MLLRQATDLIRQVPEAATQIAAIAEQVEAGTYYRALKLSRKLVEWESAGRMPVTDHPVAAEAP